MKSTKSLAIVSILALLLFGTCTFFMRNLLFGGVVATYEQAEPNSSEYKDQWISYEVVACLGCYAESTETYSFIPTGHSYYYAIWMEDGSIMPLSVSKKADRDYLDALTDATYDYVDGKTKMIEMEPRTFTGTIGTQDKEIAGYYKDALTSIDISESDGWVIRSVLLDCSNTRTGYLLLVGAVMMIPVSGIALTIRNIAKEKRRNKNPEQEYLPR